ncbi:hypothetical protein ACXGQW_07255 [Wenyingzhuangia sp. IMCC45533]
MKKSIFHFLISLSFMVLVLPCTAQAPLQLAMATKKTSIYKYRKYNHVKELYGRISAPVIQMCIEYKIPPAAVLSIISLESGWGQGYIGRITGNFLSLNAVGTEAELPALRMPKSIKTKNVILGKKALAKTLKTDIIWEIRPASLKKDYRPSPMAGTIENLDYFIDHPYELTKANLENVRDFATRFISYTSRIRAYNQARELLDNKIATHGINILFDENLNIQFINTIGGKPNSFNYRKTWSKKAINILKNVGAVELSKDLYLYHKTFKEAW